MGQYVKVILLGCSIGLAVLLVLGISGCWQKQQQQPDKEPLQYSTTPPVRTTDQSAQPSAPAQVAQRAAAELPISTPAPTDTPRPTSTPVPPSPTPKLSPEDRLGLVVDEFVRQVGDDSQWIPRRRAAYDAYNGETPVYLLWTTWEQTDEGSVSLKESDALMASYFNAANQFGLQEGRQMFLPYFQSRGSYYEQVRMEWLNSVYSRSNPVWRSIIGNPQAFSSRFRFWGSLPSKLQDRQAIRDYVFYLKSVNPNMW